MLGAERGTSPRNRQRSHPPPHRRERDVLDARETRTVLLRAISWLTYNPVAHLSRASIRFPYACWCWQTPGGARSSTGLAVIFPRICFCVDRRRAVWNLFPFFQQYPRCFFADLNA